MFGHTSARLGPKSVRAASTASGGNVDCTSKLIVTGLCEVSDQLPILGDIAVPVGGQVVDEPEKVGQGW
jgi:hypothetical protein